MNKLHSEQTEKPAAPSSSLYTLQQVETEQQLRDALSVRRAVFIVEQQVPAAIEIDEHDRIGSGTAHFVAYREGQPVGASRLRPYAPGIGKVERVAVASSERGTGLGRLLMQVLEESAQKLGYQKLKLNAQTHAQRFYEKLGYHPVGPLFEEAGIEHVSMEKSLTDTSS